MSNLGVLIDGQLSIANHVASLCRSCFFQLRQLHLVRPVVTSKAANTLVHAFVSSRLDYCKCLLYGVSDDLLKKLQAVQNSAARVVTGTRKFDHITPVLRDLHWLSIRQRIRFKLAMIIFKCLQRSGFVVHSQRLCPALGCCRSTTSAVCRHHETVGTAN